MEHRAEVASQMEKISICNECRYKKAVDSPEKSRTTVDEAIEWKGGVFIASACCGVIGS